MAAAAAARTETLGINVGALLALMYDPIKLAEDMAVLDHLSGGRVSYTIGLGYRDEEYAMFGVDPSRRAALMDEHLDVLRRALDGETFEWRGRTIKVRPRPATEGGPPLAYGGGSKAAARRAARHGLVFSPQHSDPALAEAYDAAATEAGNPTGLTLAPAAGSPTTVFVSDDVDRAWREIGPHMLHDAVTYADWLSGASSSSVSPASTVEELRAENGPYRIVTPTEAAALRDEFYVLALQPFCGGCPPELAWETLHLIESRVL
jgi:alkanesulfonate monooxygenase SsuD/methylene tetrahydromethanopterin reductase-like flavin-dependent oxidoreductase (luciferase family)